MVAEGAEVSRIVCWLRGHRWRVLGGDFARNERLFWIHPYIGLTCICERCGKSWDDAGPGLGFTERTNLPRAVVHR